MKKKNSRRKQAKFIRSLRKIHRTAGALLFIFFFVIAITGLILGWKHHSFGKIQPKSQNGSSVSIEEWLPMDSLQTLAFEALHNTVSPKLSLKLDRIDARPSKGMLKFVFKEHYWEVQLDGATGEVLSLNKRFSDIIENIHDGSLLDHVFGTPNKFLKVSYTSIMGLALLVFTITGFWLWYGPKRMRRMGKS